MYINTQARGSNRNPTKCLFVSTMVHLPSKQVLLTNKCGKVVLTANYVMI